MPLTPLTERSFHPVSLRTTVVCPTVDSVDADTYEYHPQGDGLCRGIFNWDFWYKRVSIEESRERLGLKHRSEAYA